MIVSLDETLQFLDIEGLEFSITGNNNILMLKYDGGETTTIQLVNDTYSSSSMVSQLTSAINTAFSISCSVSFSSDKFSIDVGSGHTIQYIHLDSTAGTDLGFTTDSTVSESITSDSKAGDPTAIIDMIRGMIDAETKTYCKRDFEEATYKEVINSDGVIFTKHFPIISVSRASTGSKSGLSIKSTGATTFATASITQDKLTLVSDNETSEISISSEDTLEDLWTSINLLSGWEALVDQSNEYHLATDLIPEEGLYCFNEWAYLDLRDGYLSRYDIEYSTGSIVPSTPVIGKVMVDYTAGYNPIPEDLKLAVLVWIKTIYDKRNEEVFGVRTFTLDRVRKSYFNSIPVEVRDILDMYRKYDW